MSIKNKGGLYRLVIPLLILMMACSLAPSIPMTGGNGYQYDGLPGRPQEGSAIAEYHAISKWASADFSTVQIRVKLGHKM